MQCSVCRIDFATLGQQPAMATCAECIINFEAHKRLTTLPKLTVELTSPTSRLPSRQHSDDAGYDLYANETLTINVGATKLVKCGIKMAIPPGYVGFICPRSGLALKHGITVLNGPGVIDSGYVGEIGVVLINFGVRNFEVTVGDRIGQIVFIELAKLDTVAGKVDGGRSGGFGSTGV